ncbi:MAG TPA: hypothetical protein VEG63_11335 [Candidatus Acidoferrales bacterium]|nr:hypothetical protein [Candidatus Acidoferrales bacterium]
MDQKTLGAWLIACLAFAAVAAGAGRTSASPQNDQAIDPKFFADLHWRSIGPPRGGRVLSVTGVRGQPDLYYFGSVGGGVWKTTDAGRTWNPIFDSQPVASIGAIAVAPSNPSIIYVGSGEADMRSSISAGNGMYKSTDAGASWTRIGLRDSRAIGRILVDPHDPARVWVAVLGHPYGPSAERGVFRSTDGGLNWQRILFKDENTGAIDIAFDPGNHQTIWAALWQTRRPPWSVYPPSYGPGSGLYRSTDGGEHWEQITGHGLPSEGLGRIGIAFAPSNPQRMYLIVDAKQGGLFRSDDAGLTWQRGSTDRRIWGRGWYFGELSVDPKNPDVVYVLNTAAYKSTDGGATFNAWKGAPGGDDYHELWIDPDQPLRMIMSCDQGAIVTRNGGRTWSSWYNQPIGQFYHVITDNRFPYWVYGAEQDSGAAATPSRSIYQTLDFHDWRPMEAGGENGYIAPDPLNPGVIFGGTVTRQNFENEDIQFTPPGLAHAGNFRHTWTLPLVFSPLDPQVLYFGSQNLFRTSDGGASWQMISPDLTREDPGVPANLDPATAADAPASRRRGVIYTIAPSSLQAGEIWAGTDDGLIQLTLDEGKTWKDVTPPGVTPWTKVTHIEASHSHPATAYAAVDRHRLEDTNPYLYRTRDYGRTWQHVTRGIPEGSFLNCIREDPGRKGLLYACTETGVYVSFDDGDNWQSLQLNMPTVSIRDLVVHGDDLVVATFGRAFWILDDASLLRQLDPQAEASDVWLFPPQTAYRVRPGSDQATPVPADEPKFANPPDGAIFDYYLKEKSASPIQLEIFDSGGKLVRRFSSDDRLERTDPNSVPFTMNWVPVPQPLSADAGMYRFVWDLRAAMPAGMRRSFRLSGGPWIVPGDYIVKLTAAGKTLTQPLTVKMDPRSHATFDALQRQFALASQLGKQWGEVSAALRQAEDLRKQAEERKKDAAANSAILAVLSELSAKIVQVTGAEGEADFGGIGPTLPDREHEPIRRVSSALSGILAVEQSADVAPTADVTTAANRWEAARADSLAEWNKLLDDVRTRINPDLEKAGLKPLIVK